MPAEAASGFCASVCFCSGSVPGFGWGFCFWAHSEVTQHAIRITRATVRKVCSSGETYTINLSVLNSQQNLHIRKNSPQALYNSNSQKHEVLEMVATFREARVKLFRSFICCSIILFLAQTNGAQITAAKTSAPSRLSGYMSQSSSPEQEWEKKFQDGIVRENLRENMRRLSARPHHVGSPYDKDNAEWILARFKEWGFDARIESFNVLFPPPKDRVVELLGPAPFRAKLQEPAVGVDPTSDQTSEQLPTYNAYSADGDVTAPLVYVNYGIREDYEQLDRLGISVAGAIVIARYGAGWRGTKPKVAAEHGAVGCIIYSDPEGDGYHRGDEYPAGGWGPREGVQRGRVMDPHYPGGPLPPGVGATADAKRLAIKGATPIAKIPALPISDADALPLLSALSGTVAPEDWRGALPITYHIGPGAAKVHLKVASNWDIKPIYDVI